MLSYHTVSHTWRYQVISHNHRRQDRSPANRPRDICTHTQILRDVISHTHRRRNISHTHTHLDISTQTQTLRHVRSYHFIPLIIGLFCGKWYHNISPQTQTLRHVRSRPQTLPTDIETSRTSMHAKRDHTPRDAEIFERTHTHQDMSYHTPTHAQTYHPQTPKHENAPTHTETYHITHPHTPRHFPRTDTETCQGTNRHWDRSSKSPTHINQHTQRPIISHIHKHW